MVKTNTAVVVVVE